MISNALKRRPAMMMNISCNSFVRRDDQNSIAKLFILNDFLRSKIQRSETLIIFLYTALSIATEFFVIFK